VNSRAYKIYTAEGSRYIARFDPEIEQDGSIYGRMSVVGYSEVAEKALRIIGIAPEPEAGGRLLISDRPWAVEMVNGEEVPLYEYENISMVEDISHLLEHLINEEKQEVESREAI
jgi:hypothetical protein